MVLVRFRQPSHRHDKLPPVRRKKRDIFIADFNEHGMDLGPANSPESHEAYNRFIAELAQSSGRPQLVVVEASEKQCLTIGELMLAFLPWVKERV